MPRSPGGPPRPSLQLGRPCLDTGGCSASSKPLRSQVGVHRQQGCEATFSGPSVPRVSVQSSKAEEVTRIRHAAACSPAHVGFAGLSRKGHTSPRTPSGTGGLALTPLRRVSVLAFLRFSDSRLADSSHNPVSSRCHSDASFPSSVSDSVWLTEATYVLINNTLKI